MYLRAWNNGKKNKVIIICHALIIYLAIKIEESKLFSYILNGSCTRDEIRDLLFPYSIMTVVIFAGILVFIKNLALPKNSINRIACAIFSFILLAGHCYSNVESFFIIFNSKITIIAGMCYFLGFYLVLGYLWGGVEKAIPKIDSFLTRISFQLSDNYLFFRAWICMFVCWLPYIIIRYPAGIEWDAYHQIEQFLGFETLTAHWPVCSTLLMGTWVKLGELIFRSYNAGVFLFVLFQMSICISVLSYSLVFMKKIGIRKIWIIVVLANYSLVPLYPGYFTSVVKDALFSIMVLLDILLVADKLLFKKKGILALTLVSAAVCLLRNNGVYIIFFWLIAWILYYFIKRDKGIILLCVSMAIAFIIFEVYSSVLLPNLNILQDTAKETLSIPFQQTARYLKEYPEDISTEELEIIGKVLDVKTIADVYNPVLSDAVKDTYHGKETDLKAYFKVWFQMFLRHPGIYFDATLHNCYGFFYPDAQQANNILGVFIGTISNDKLTFNEPEILKPLVDLLRSYIRFWERSPFTFLFCNTGIQMWVALWLILYCLKEKDEFYLMLLIPSIVGVLVCIASPTWWNNGFRYALPVICANPLLLCMRRKTILMT